MAIVPFDAVARARAAGLWAAPVSIDAERCALRPIRRRPDTLAFVSQDFEHAPAIFAGAGAAPRQITHDNDGWAPIVTARSLTWKSGPYTVQGWLLAPRNAAGGQGADGRPACTAVRPRANTPGFVWQGSTPDLDPRGLLPLPAQSARQLRTGRGLHPRQHPRLRRRRPQGHPRRHRRGRDAPHRSTTIASA